MAFGVLGGLDAAGRIADIVERLMDDSGIRQKFDETGQIAVQIKVEQYEIDLTLRRRDE
ncbi:MAG TPA: hypothetical protein PKV78_05405 [Methanoculleus thermophilus]|nr:hypothetical protein [Bacillota bacterium]HQD25963.1 hypothetical protein [Methanoculleus thermophilus]